MDLKELLEVYQKIENDISQKLNLFENNFKSDDDSHVFKEMAFCILTPQSSARNSWSAIETMGKDLFLINAEQISTYLIGVRFKLRKSSYIELARERYFNEKLKKDLLSFKDELSRREWLVKNVKGYGYKEASHFLRNISLSGDLAILDRHILRNLKTFSVIDEIPKSMTKKQYLEIERKMQEFSKQISVPMTHLDFLFWYLAKGELFK